MLSFADNRTKYKESLSIYAHKHILVLHKTFQCENSPQNRLQLTSEALQRCNSFDQTSLSRVFFVVITGNMWTRIVYNINHKFPIKFICVLVLPKTILTVLQIVGSLNHLTLVRNAEAALVEMVHFTITKVDYF